MRTAFLVFLFSVSLLALTACEDPAAQFNKSLDDVLTIEKNRRGTLFAQNGAPGPYRESGCSSGNVNSAGHIAAGEGSGRAKISWPATEGYFYEGTAYLNAEGGAFLVVRKVPAK